MQKLETRGVGGVGEGKDVTIPKRLDKDLYELLFFQENQIIT